MSIVRADETFITALGSRLSTLLLPTYAYQGLGRGYWDVAPEGCPFPLVVYQIQDPVSPAPYLNYLSARLVVVLRGIGLTPTTAATVRDIAHTAITSLTPPSGWAFSVTWDGSPVIPSDGTVFTLAHQYRVAVDAGGA